MNESHEFWAPIINDFNPVGPTSPKEVSRYFVDRNENDPTRSLVRRLSANFRLSKGQKTPYKALLTGHTGSGKSSELIRVGVELSRDFLVFWFDAERSLVIEKATVFEVILGLGLAVHKAATQSDLQPNPQLAQKLLNSLSKFVRTHEERKGFSLKLQPVLKQITATVIGTGAGATVAGPVGAM
ncbi:MAG: hypothetical protein ACREAM_28000, partial [Blastocatellia bacterium]